MNWFRHKRTPSSRARGVEEVAWRLPWLSMGCRSVDILPVLKRAGGKVVFLRTIGVPLWPFLVFIVEKAEEQKGGQLKGDNL